MSPYKAAVEKASYMREWAGARRQDLREAVELWREYLGYRCQRCGAHDTRREVEAGAAAAPRFDWHHVDPRSKSFEINDAVNKRANFGALMLELLKCAYLCAPCHRRVHKEIDGWG